MDNLDLLDTVLAELPDGWEIIIRIERASHIIRLYHSERKELLHVDTCKGLHADVREAIDIAKVKEKISESSVDKALSRFYATIKRLGV